METRVVALSRLTLRSQPLGLAAAIFACMWSACAGNDPGLLNSGAAGGPAPVEVATPGAVHVRYEPGEGSLLDLGSTPWPDDL